MELDDIINAASLLIKEGTLILHRSMKVHPKFRVYKKFLYDLYKVNGNSKELLFSFEEVKNTPSDDIMKIWSECDKVYLGRFIKWVSSDEYRNMKRDGI